MKREIDLNVTHRCAVLFRHAVSTENARWHSLAAAGLAREHGESEPDYSAAMKL
jgi:hypothetical protein